MIKQSLNAKLALTVMLVVILVVAAVSFFVWRSQNNLMQQVIEDRLEAAELATRGMLEQNSRQALAASLTLANLPKLQEAARAGENGRGFAVVASEVRNLAARSAESATEIERLITESMQKVQRGNQLMKDTREILDKIVDNNQRIAEAVEEISSSLSEQSGSADQISNALSELNDVTQQNASLVEEIASSSENMQNEVKGLSDEVGEFKLE